jgi:hypothetical protein
MRSLTDDNNNDNHNKEEIMTIQDWLAHNQAVEMAKKIRKEYFAMVDCGETTGNINADWETARQRVLAKKNNF